MAVDESSLEVFRGRTDEVTSGHYGFRADDFDGPAASLVDPVEEAQQEALRATTELNALPKEERTPEAIERVETLTEEAAKLAYKANVGLVQN